MYLFFLLFYHRIIMYKKYHTFPLIFTLSGTLPYLWKAAEWSLKRLREKKKKKKRNTKKYKKHKTRKNKSKLRLVRLMSQGETNILVKELSWTKGMEKSKVMPRNSPKLSVRLTLNVSTSPRIASPDSAPRAQPSAYSGLKKKKE